jgi:hypothetical protein
MKDTGTLEGGAGPAAVHSRAATVDDPVVCGQPKIRRWPQAAA